MSSKETELVEGCRVLCEALVQQGIKYMFGVVGIPVIEIAVAAQASGMKYFGMRNEQAVRVRPILIFLCSQASC